MNTKTQHPAVRDCWVDGHGGRLFARVWSPAAATDRAPIILLHDSGGDRTQTIQAIPRIVQELRQRGFQFVSVGELLGRSRDAVMPLVPPDSQWRTWLDGAAFVPSKLTVVTPPARQTRVFQDFDAALASLDLKSHTVLPRAAWAQHYEEVFAAAYRELYRVLRPINHGLNGIERGSG